MVLSMGRMPVPEGIESLSAADLALSVAYYERTAPKALARIPQLSGPGTKLRFQVEHFTPKGLQRERIPAVANVAFVQFLN